MNTSGALVPTDLGLLEPNAVLTVDGFGSELNTKGVSIGVTFGGNFDPLGVTNPNAVISDGAAWTDIGDHFELRLGSLSVESGATLSTESGTIGQDVDNPQLGQPNFVVATVDGQGSAWNVSGNLVVGAAASDGAPKTGEQLLRVSDGGTVNAGLGLGVGTAAEGRVLLEDAGSTLSAPWVVLGTAPNAQGTFEIDSGGAANVGPLFVADAAGATAKVIVSGDGSLLTSNSVYVGTGGNGEFDVEAEGEATARARALTIGADGGTGDSTISDLPTNGDDTLTVGNLYVGKSGGTGTLTIDNSARVTSTQGGSIGSRGGVGTVTVEGAGTSWGNSTGWYYVGLSGDATLNVENGATVTMSRAAVNNVGIGGFAKRTATVNVTSGGNWNITDPTQSFYVGLAQTGPTLVTVTGQGSQITYAGQLMIVNANTILQGGKGGKIISAQQGTGGKIVPTDNTALIIPGGQGHGDVFTFDADLDMSSGGTLVATIGGANLNDKLVVNGTATLGTGLLTVPTDGFGAFAPGQQYTVLTATTVSGQFANLQPTNTEGGVRYLDVQGAGALPELPSGLEWEVEYSSTSVTLVVVPTVSIQSNGDIYETDTSPGSFTVTRTGPTTNSLTVSYTTSGSAVAGTDYTGLSGTVTIPAGSRTATVYVYPQDDGDSDDNQTSETLTVKLKHQLSLYALGTPQSADMTIKEETTPTVTIAATAPNAVEYGSPGQFTVSRTGPTDSSLTVNLSASGTAVAGTNYQGLPSSVTIPAGSPKPCRFTCKA